MASYDDYPGGAAPYTQLLCDVMGDAQLATRNTILVRPLKDGSSVVFEHRPAAQNGGLRGFRVAWCHGSLEKWFALGKWLSREIAVLDHTSNLYDAKPVRMTGKNNGLVSDSIDRIYEDFADHLIEILCLQGQSIQVESFLEAGRGKGRMEG